MSTSTEVFNPQKPSISMSKDAINNASRHLKPEQGEIGIAVRVKKNGCSGYGYVVEKLKERQDQDIEFKQSETVSVFIKEADLPFLNGTHIEMEQNGINRYYRFDNPNAKAECGCGESFAV